MENPYDYNQILNKVSEADREEVKERLMILVNSVARTTFTECKGEGKLANKPLSHEGVEAVGKSITDYYSQFIK